MTVNGVLGSMCFPSFPQFCGQLFARREDKDEALAMVRAYNDWHIDRWCGAEPGRFIPLSIPAIWDPELGRPRRCAGWPEGLPRRHLLGEPREARLALLHNEYWDPFWTACADEGTVVCMHLGSSSQILMTSMEAPIDVMISLQPINMVQAAADLSGRPSCASTRTCASPSPRAASAGSPTPSSASTTSTSTTTSGPARTSATSCRARSSRTASSPASSTTPSAWTAAST